MQRKICLTLAVCALSLAGLACEEQSSKKLAPVQPIEESDSQVQLAYDATSGLFENLEASRSGELLGLKSEFTNCSEAGRNSKNANIVFDCSKAFERELATLLSKSIPDLKQKNEVRRAQLDAALLLASPEHEPIKQSLAKVWGQYEDCQKNTAFQADARKIAAQLKGCEVTVDLQLKTLEQQLTASDVDILDTF